MHLDIREVMGTVERGDAAAQPPAPAQVSGLPLHLLAQLDQATLAASDDLLTGMSEGALMEVQVPREIEHALGRRGDEGFQAEAGHGHSLGRSPEVSRQ